MTTALATAVKEETVQGADGLKILVFGKEVIGDIKGWIEARLPKRDDQS